MKKIFKSRYKLYSSLSFACCMMFMVSCTDWDEFKKYNEGGEIVYPGKFDTVAIFSGDQRVQLRGTLTADPKVTSTRIFWNNNQDSVEFPIEFSGSDFVFDEIVDVAEGTHSFTLYTYDNAGNKSVGYTVTGKSYGQRYRNTLVNRRIQIVNYGGSAPTIYWDDIDQKLGPYQMEVRYKTPFGDTAVFTSATALTTKLKGLDYENDGFWWRMIFKPDDTAIDTFATEFDYLGVPTFMESEINRSNFSAVSMTGDASANGWSGGVASMWDGAALDCYGCSNFTDIGSGGSSPQMVTVDLGSVVQVSEITMYPFKEHWLRGTWYSGLYYVFSAIRDYEIYGSANPSSNGALDESWTLLASGTVTKPSGLPEAQESAEDEAAALAGIKVTADPSSLPVRYLRIRCLKNYEGYYYNNSAAFFSVAELYVNQIETVYE